MSSRPDEPDQPPGADESTITPGAPGAQQSYLPYQPTAPYQPTPTGPARSGAPAQPFAGRPSTNALAIASLVCSLVWVCGAGSLAAVITGHLARGQVRRTGEPGGGLALAGLVLGYLGLALVVGYLAFIVVVLAVDPGWLDE